MAESASSEPQEFVCIDRLPPSQDVDVVQAALNENPANGIHSSGPYTPPTEDGTGKSEDLPAALVLNVSKYWAAGRTLKVKFLSGDAALRERVKKFASQWELYANITFKWVSDDEPRAHIRVDFQRGDGHYSYLGTDNLGIPQGQKTMNLDVTSASSDEQVRRVALHEFGHALGCEHEHQSPNATFVWNADYVYNSLGGPPNCWSRAMVDRNVLNRLNPAQVSATAFDSASIMCYAFPSQWFMPGTGAATNNNTRLSQRDKDFIATAYPPNYSDIGLFNTMQVRAWDAASTGRDALDVPFVPIYPAPPRLALGLTWLDLKASEDLYVLANAEEVTRESFTVSMTSRPPSHVYSAATSWLEVAATETEIVVGTVDFTAPGSKTVNFESRFESDEAPTVIAFLTGFEIGKESTAYKLKTYPKEATPYKFKLQLETGDGVAIRSAKVTYVAFPRGKAGIAGGVFSTDDVPGLLNAGSTTFEAGAASFTKPPQLFCAVTGFNFGVGRNLRLRLSTSLVSTGGFDWNFDSWFDSILNSATAAYVAILPAKPDKDEQ